MKTIYAIKRATSTKRLNKFMCFMSKLGYSYSESRIKGVKFYLKFTQA